MWGISGAFIRRPMRHSAPIWIWILEEGGSYKTENWLPPPTTTSGKRGKQNYNDVDVGRQCKWMQTLRICLCGWACNSLFIAPFKSWSPERRQSRFCLKTEFPESVTVAPKASSHFFSFSPVVVFVVGLSVSKVGGKSPSQPNCWLKKKMNGTKCRKVAGRRTISQRKEERPPKKCRSAKYRRSADYFTVQFWKNPFRAERAISLRRRRRRRRRMRHWMRQQVWTRQEG